ncbi:hypothetical protein [Nocardioides sp. PD653]|uniref:hypothetical protein n=1 Tax=Nocardioides sp. PD653 TaxID=393303 RepID=UPI0009EF8693|nr:hypothetical protein [Nocardioides sp. PD653]GAW54764.1 uncharacterized protein PD653_2178 [Nocardioides sp. PD653]
MDDLHLQADLFFGPCNDPDCPGAVFSDAQRPRVDLEWPTKDYLHLIRGGRDQSGFSGSE